VPDRHSALGHCSPFALAHPKRSRVCPTCVSMGSALSTMPPPLLALHHGYSASLLDKVLVSRELCTLVEGLTVRSCVSASIVSPQFFLASCHHGGPHRGP
jgi:hypothetical protein